MKIILIAILIAVASVAVQAQEVDFTGNWKLQTKRSEFGNVPVRAAIKSYTVVQKDDKLSLAWTTEGADGKDVSSEQKMYFPRETASFLLPSGRTRVMTASFSKDGKNLQLNKSYSKVGKPEELDYELKEAWSLSADGKELITTITSPGYTIKAVYDKVEGNK